MSFRRADGRQWRVFRKLLEPDPGRWNEIHPGGAGIAQLPGVQGDRKRSMHESLFSVHAS